MTEPTIQVPVALIEGMPHEDWCAARRFPREQCDCYRSRFTALLSQPTPTAEPMTLDQRAVAAFGPEVLERTGPPRIEDMEPGTTFRAQAYAQAYQMWRVVNATTVEHQSGFHHHVSVIDPSTIRDVTPPK